MIKGAIEKVVERVDLEEEEMVAVMNEIMEGKAKPSQISAFLTAIRMKGECIDEITGAASVMREKCLSITPEDPDTIDLCGTGGDSKGTFNVSTAASIIAAGAGVSIAKHGNRSVSSSVGSADVLEELGVNIDLSPDQAEQCLNKTGITFLFAPLYHPAMKNVAEPRRELGIRTIFNILGPMTNPAGVKNQVMGIYSELLLEPIAKSLRNLGSVRAMLVHGFDGTDELTVTGKTHVAELKEGIVKTYQIDPSDVGLAKHSLEDIKGGGAKENAQIILAILRGEEKGAKRDIAALNAAAGIMVANTAEDLKEDLEAANEAIESKKALNKLNELVSFTRAFG